VPVALMFVLRPLRPARPDAALGRAAQAMALQLIAEANPALAAVLHNESAARPLTVTPPLNPDGQTPTIVTPDHTYGLRLALAGAELERLAAQWEAHPPQQLAFGDVAWQVEQVTSNGVQHPWAGRAGYSELVAAGVAAEEARVRRWALEFAAPVTFRRKGMNMPLPLPELVFGSLLDRWNATAPLPLPGELREYAAEQVAVERLELRSVRMVGKGGVPQIGAVGRCSYVLAGKDTSMAGIIETLCRAAFYSGVGAGTTRGMGLTRLVSTSR
jgi:CRISPR-associated endoribonuclease Cas6